MNPHRWPLLLLCTLPLIGEPLGELRLVSGRSIPLVTLKSNGTEVVMAPDLGAKILSIKGPGGQEILSRSSRPYVERVVGMKYTECEFDGLDEIFPSLAPCGGGENHPAIPDHGEVWCLPWRVLSPDTLEARGNLLPYTLTRRLTLTGSSVVFSYRLSNTGGVAFPYIYLFHPLFRATHGFKLGLPGAAPMTIKGSSKQFLGVKGTQTNWGALVSGPLEDRIFVSGRGRYWNLMGESFAPGAVAIYPGIGNPFTLSWDIAELPHVALWSTEGAILGGLEHLAVEPTGSPLESLAAAVREGKAPQILPGKTREWKIVMTFDPGPTTR